MRLAFNSRYHRAILRLGLIPAVALLLPAAAPCVAQVTATPLNKNGIYDVNEKAGWTLTLPEGAAAPTAPYTYTIKTNNLDVLKQGELDLSKGKATLDITVDKPAMLYVQITPPVAARGPAPGAGAVDGAGGPGGAAGGARRGGAGGFGRGRGGGGGMTLGAAIAPTKLEPSVPRPADFDAFWDGKLKALAEVPMNPELKPVAGTRQGLEMYTVKLDSLNSHTQGYLAKPAKEGKFPAIAIFEWAGVHALSENTVTDRAREGWLAFNVESHDMPPTSGNGAPMNYQTVGNTDKEQSYFLNMYLRDARAMQYLMSRPDWDGKTLVVMGTSMGGQQSFCTAGLMGDKVTHLIVHVPSGSDTNGQLHGRQAGYPNWPSNNAAVMQTALYFDPVNFAPRIKATCLVSMGFIDTTAPAVGIWTTFNQIRSPKEAAPMIDAGHNNVSTPAQQLPFTSRSTEWLNAIVKGEAVKPNPEMAQPAHTP
ncbi:MAG TPA: acetylxylan esterase [Phycisphaerae bacterium]